jgi:hypothetical protein
MGMLEQFISDAFHDCCRRSAEARRIADAATNDETSSDLLEFEHRRLILANSFKPGASKKFAVGWCA